MSAPGSGISKVATTAVVIAAVGLSLPAIGVVGIHLGALAPMIGFGMFVAGALLGGALALLLGIAGFAITRGGGDPDGRTRSLTAIGGGVALLGVVAMAGAPGGGLPPINDITTDLADPPHFEADPAGLGRDMTYPAEFVPQVEQAYADLKTVELTDAPSAVFERALAAADELGWELTARNPAAGTFEARDSTAIFQFVDDVSVRIRATPKGSEVDVRSKSRDGRGDVGANAARIRRFFETL